MNITLSPSFPFVGTLSLALLASSVLSLPTERFWIATHRPPRTDIVAAATTEQ
jgi:hypothetical protein